MEQRWFAADGVFSARSSVLLAANLMQRGRLNAGDADVMRPQALDTVQGLPELAPLRTFIRVLSDCCYPLHLGPDEYYFLIALKTGAEKPGDGDCIGYEYRSKSGAVFFVCTERFIPLVPC